MKKIVLVNILDVVSSPDAIVFLDFAEQIRKRFTAKHHVSIAVICTGDLRFKSFGDKLACRCFTYKNDNRQEKIKNPNLFALNIYDILFGENSYDYVLCLVHYSEHEIYQVFNYLGIKKENFTLEKIEKIPYFFAKFKTLRKK